MLPYGYQQLKQSLIDQSLADWILRPSGTTQGVQANQVEVLPYRYYHWQDFAAGVAIPATVTFFNVAPGAAITGGLATEEDTNLDKPGAIASPNKFLALGLSCEVLPAAANQDAAVEGSVATGAGALANDIMAVYNRGVANLVSLNKSYAKLSPMRCLPSGMGPTGSLFADGTTTDPKVNVSQALSNGAPISGNQRRIEVALEPEASFSLVLSFPKGVVTPTVAIRVGFLLDGVLQRPKV